ncbi:MAG: cofactor-independent phosphoglycerate mutase [Candidatus Dadabacteria bacterium]|nr:cofactor-independent phosphoglycerate mutase [Candidatus Dadabacteria bacterium]NIS07178.1 cofactor-independent phosphoglycerate mutase [Candidatus Dadabacteria bacterium]NIV41222.1 cofactor-independent phosphoglycerate mutase [Candidatus Dadabacteria bacterium]NIX14307.1 cofactor-independent phosphoglycerate mutase [Candidatus Dadabacteria bacterium]NIY20956.1 cofactor-independent phosphoglycerate mutase [Candidatus Dadabacteria bacterium]
MKYVILQGDGMPDHKLPELGGKTPLEAADTPNLDYIAKHAGTFGTVKTIPDNYPPGSDVGNLTVLGYDPTKYYTGRSPLEAASIGVELEPADVALRCNLVTLSGNSGREIMEDYSAGHITTEEAHEIIKDIKAELDGGSFTFHPGISYRHLLVWSHGNKDLNTTPPHDISGKEINPNMPQGKGSDKLIKLIEKSQQILKDHPVNKKRIEQGHNPVTSIWLWGQGTAPKMPGFKELYGLTGSVISAVDLVKGIGHYAKLDVIDVPGATGYLDTNYEGKVEYALNSLNEVDLTMIHIESTDETGHVGDPKLKIQAVEDFDKRVVANVLKGIKKFGEYRILVMSDHPTPIDIRTHTSDPVPFAILSSDDTEVRNENNVYTEDCAAGTGEFEQDGWRLLSRLIEKS